MIREILAMAGIEVAADTVRRFYRQVIEEPRTGTKRSSKREQPYSRTCAAELASPSRCHVADRRRSCTTCAR